MGPAPGHAATKHQIRAHLLVTLANRHLGRVSELVEGPHGTAQALGCPAPGPGGGEGSSGALSPDGGREMPPSCNSGFETAEHVDDERACARGSPVAGRWGHDGLPEAPGTPWTEAPPRLPGPPTLARPSQRPECPVGECSWGRAVLPETPVGGRGATEGSRGGDAHGTHAGAGPRTCLCGCLDMHTPAPCEARNPGAGVSPRLPCPGSRTRVAREALISAPKVLGSRPGPVRRNPLRC